MFWLASRVWIPGPEPLPAEFPPAEPSAGRLGLGERVAAGSLATNFPPLAGPAPACSTRPGAPPG